MGQPPLCGPLPSACRGVWRRSLLAAPGVHDTTTLAFWMPASRRHGYIRIPAGRPDFSGVRALTDCSEVGQGDALRQQLDFEISCGERNAGGWQIRHSTLPWREGAQVALTLSERDDGSVQLDIDGIASRWEVLEWTPPRVR